MKLKITFLIIVSFVFLETLSAQKKLVDSTTYKEWRRVDSGELSADGRFVSYKYNYLNNDNENKKERNKYYFYDTKTEKRFVIDSASNMNFWAGGKWVIYDEKINNVENIVLVRLRDNKKIIWDRAGSPNTDSNYPIISYYKNENKDFVVMNMTKSDSVIYKNIARPSLYDRASKIMYIKKGEVSNDLCFGNVRTPKKYKTIYSDKSKKLLASYSYLNI